MPNKNPVMTNGTCLVVSNCKSCWDTSSKLAFVSCSIPDYLDAEWLKTIDHIILDGPWESKEYRIESRQFVVERVARYRKELFPILNSALGFNYGEKAWGYLLDSWLLHFTSVVYDRVHKLENACEQLGDIFLKCVKDDLPPVLITRDFIQGSFRDSFNQQLFSEIAEALGIRVEHCVDNLPEEDLLPESSERKSFIHKVCSLFVPQFRFVFGWWIECRKPLVVLDSFFPFKETVLMFLCSLGKVLMVPSDFLLEKAPSFEKDKSLRMLLEVTSRDRFDLVANKLFAKYFPVSLLEGIKSYSEKISRLSDIPVLGAAVGFHTNDEFKILASRVIENGNQIIGFQHGGNYNFEKNKLMVCEYFEKLNVDKYYPWKKKSLSGEILPTAKLAMMSDSKKARKKRSCFVDILFVASSDGRYVYRQQSDNPDNYLKKIITRSKFYLSLNKSVGKHFLLRSHPLDLGWKHKQRWLDLEVGAVRFDPNREYCKSLVSCRIYVADHISTTWLEALFVGVPILLFFDMDRYFALDEVKVLFEDLQAVGVFHSSAESAASFLNEKYETIEDWWEMPETKMAVDKLKNYFFSTSNNFAREWTQELVTLRDRVQKGESNL
jgi:putative transferase (TIGR04331 family)